MDYAAIPSGLLRLVGGLVKYVPERLKAKRDQADRFAEYCDRIAVVLDDTIAQLRRGHRPHGNCAELDRYLQDALRILKDEFGEDDLAVLGDDLAFAYRVEYLDRSFTDPGDRERAYETVESAAGRFRALATALRATGGSLR